VVSLEGTLEHLEEEILIKIHSATRTAGDRRTCQPPLIYKMLQVVVLAYLHADNMLITTRNKLLVVLLLLHNEQIQSFLLSS